MPVPEKPRVHAAPFDSPEWRERLDKWAHAWDVAGLPDDVRIVVSRRMRVTLGVYAYREREIRIASFLLDAPAVFLQEVVCHEFAHAAMHARDLNRAAEERAQESKSEARSERGLTRRRRSRRKRASPHGAGWRQLMQQAGWIPRARIPRAELDRLVPFRESNRVVWRHRCPQCHGERLAGRPVRDWRCGRCRFFGIGGRLEIERIEL
ncbi:MAG: SprT-like domain-containing protein [Myxococcota bacterium]